MHGKRRGTTAVVSKVVRRLASKRQQPKMEIFVLFCLCSADHDNPTHKPILEN